MSKRMQLPVDVSDAEFSRDRDHKIKCPHCRDGWLTDVLDSRLTVVQDIPGIRRRRKCHGCGMRTTTFEFGEDVFEKVFKTQSAKLSFAMRIVDMIQNEVQAELIKRLGGPTDTDMR